MSIVDLTHQFTASMPVYPGDAPSELVQTASIEEHGLVHYQLNTGLHTGTHIDAPLHFIPGGARLSDLPIERFFGQGILVDMRGKTSIDADTLAHITLKPGCIALIYTGWSENFRSENYFTEYPELTAAGAEIFVRAGVSMVGFDTPSPDQAPYDVHKILLGGNVLIIENLTNLGSLIALGQFEISALPLHIDAEASPARVVARY